MRPSRLLATTGALVAVAATGCVSSSTYQMKVDELARTKQQLAQTEKDRDAAQEDDAACHTHASDCDAKRTALEQKLTEIGGSLQSAETELDTLRRQTEAAQKRLAEYQKLAAQLKKLTDAGTVSVRIRNGKMVVNLPAGVLFDSGSAQVKKDARDTLAQVAQALEQIPDRDFLVAGHTDNQPIHTREFRSNWELSTARAVQVEEILQQAGVSPAHLAAAGYAEFDPVADNTTKEGQAENRRIEIVIMPNLDELPQMPEDVASTPAGTPATPAMPPAPKPPVQPAAVR